MNKHDLCMSDLAKIDLKQRKAGGLRGAIVMFLVLGLLSSLIFYLSVGVL